MRVAVRSANKILRQFHSKAKQRN